MPSYQERSRRNKLEADQQYTKAQKQRLEPQKDDVRVGAYDGRTGRYQVLHADGGVTSNGVPLANGAPPSDGFVRGFRSAASNAIGLGYRAYVRRDIEDDVVTDEEETNIIFAFLVGDELYVGGDRAEPELVYTLEDGYTFSSNGVRTLYFDLFGSAIEPSNSNYPPRTTANLENTSTYTTGFALGTTAINIKKTGTGADDYVISFVLFNTDDSTNNIYKYGLRAISGGELTSKEIEVPQIQPSSIDPNLVSSPDVLVKDRFQTNFIFNGLGDFFFQEGYFVALDTASCSISQRISEPPVTPFNVFRLTSESRHRTISVDVLNGSEALETQYKDLLYIYLTNISPLPPRVVDNLTVNVLPDLQILCVIRSELVGFSAYTENVLPVAIDIESSTALITQSIGLPDLPNNDSGFPDPNPNFRTGLFFYSGDDGTEIPLDTVILSEDIPETVTEIRNAVKALYPNLVDSSLITVTDIPLTEDSNTLPEEGEIETNELALDGESEPDESTFEYIGITEDFQSPTAIAGISVFP